VRPGIAALFPMDGYHFDDAVLNARGHRPRKGAPHTFDLGGYRAMLDRLRADDATDIAVPVFDRTLEIARAGADIVPGPARIIVTEGNYLLLDADGWRELRSRFDIAVFVTAPMATIEERLRQRWLGFDYDDDALLLKMEGNDLPNVRLVLGSSAQADFTLHTDGSELV
jgi:pantothenate kinase